MSDSAKTSKTLILFTSWFPYGNGETYLENELPFLLERFDRIIIVTNTEETSTRRPLPENVSVFSRPYSLTVTEKLSSLAGVLSPHFKNEIALIRRTYGLALTTAIVNTVLQSLYKAQKTGAFLDNLLSRIPHSSVTLYSYWADDNAVALAFYKMQHPNVTAVTRAHRWDIYFEKNEVGYLPFRKVLAEQLNSFNFISEDGKTYFAQLTKSTYSTLKVARLGVFPISSPAEKPPGAPFHLLSCSGVIERKRVGLIAKALQHVAPEHRVKWTHIGDGPLFEELKKEVTALQTTSPNIQVNLTGNMPNKDVKAYYANNYIDLFLNVSESEGVPVSIMEAMSASIPALATNVDGNGEIVDTHTGILVDKDITPEQLAQKLEGFFASTPEQLKAYRQSAYHMFNTRYHAEKNYRDFAKTISLQ